MCGIAGYFQKVPRFNVEHIKRMTDAQKHRGPDAAGYFEHQSCGLGHRRLSILDLSDAANQPFYSQDGRYVIVYNGEVYNFNEIAEELQVKLRTTSDTEVILEAYMRWGTSFIQRMNGMFAIAIFDTLTEKLFLCRDRMGIKPIYYYQDETLIAFSSELKGILALRPDISLSLDKDAVEEYLHLGYVPEPLTMCKEVKKFPSGHYAEISKSGFEIHSYWNMADKISAETLKDEQTAKQQLKQLLNSAVRYRMISDVPFGTFLSGGIDSSVVTAIAQINSDEPVNTFSIGFTESKHNEADYARQVAKHLGTRHHEFTVSEKDAIGMIDQMVDAYDEPFADSSGIPTMLVSRLAREHVTMTLSGDGGDELFLGYGSYTWAKRMSNPLVRAFRSPIHSVLSSLNDNRYRRAALHFQKSAHPLRHIFSQEIYYFNEAEVSRLLIGAKNKTVVEEIIAGLKRKLSPEEEQAFFDMRYYLKDDLLTKVDRATMQFSLETRVPLLDYRIVEFALNLDKSLKNKDGIPKYLLKEVLYDYVPKSFFDRPKWGFSIPLDKWLTTDLNYLIDQYTSKEICVKYGLIRFEELDKYRQEFKKGRTYLYNRLWQIILLHRHLEHTGIR
jgi:asparagine synthase (glutamine-hydrolysing)